MVIKEDTTQADRFKIWKQIQARQNEDKKKRLLSYLLNQIVLLEGKKGRGKSLSSVALAYELREMFGKPVIIVGTKVGMTDNFGPFKFLSERDFVEQLDQISDIANTDEEGAGETAVERALKSLNIDILDSTILFDEAIKLFDSRTPSDKLVRLFGYFVAQSRHYNITMVITIPNRDNLDKRVRRQIDWFGRCTTTCRTLNRKCIRPGCRHITTIRFVGGIDRFKLRLEGTKYWSMFNSWSIVGFRRSQTNIKNY
jgi:hypothetical protein